MAALLTSLGISIHAPREGGDGLITRRSKRLKLFQSTPPARGATINNHIVVNPCRFQSTPPARGATIIAIGVPKLFYISIHAPREGGDDHGIVVVEVDDKFQSTPPARGATFFCQVHSQGFAISIHAPREGGDLLYGKIRHLN